MPAWDGSPSHTDEVDDHLGRLPVWQDQGACRGMDPDLWFPPQGGPTNEAKAVCAACPVQGECLDYALAAQERFGIWGGKSEKQRRRMRRATKAHRAAQHGSTMYGRGCRCDVCVTAKARILRRSRQQVAS